MQWEISNLVVLRIELYGDPDKLKQKAILSHQKQVKCFLIFCLNFQIESWGYETVTKSSKVYTCKICGRQMLSNADLVKHTRTHTREKPFKCPFCDCKTTQTSSLYRHMKIKHKKTM